MSTTEFISPNVASKDFDQMLNRFMEWLQTYHIGEAEEAKGSSDLLGLGVKNEFAQSWESFFSNPVESFIKTKSSIEDTLIGIVDAIITKFIESRKAIIESAGKVKSNGVNICYCISLKEDTLENRMDVNEFFDFYDDYTTSTEFPVYFQFVPSEFMNKVTLQKKII